jgi:prepilin-type processing-associated H-X9-DG protein
VKPPPIAEAGGAPKRKASPLPWILGVGGIGCCVLCLPIGGAILLPIFRQARLGGQGRVCISRLKIQSVALLLYAENNDEKLPARNWIDSITPLVAPDKGLPIYFRQEERSFRCPAVPRGDFGYAFNRSLVGESTDRVTDKKKAVLTFDSNQLERNATASPSDVPSEGRHGGKNNFSYLDGHAQGIVPVR